MEFVDFLTVFLCTFLYFFLDTLWHSKFFFAQAVPASWKKRKYGWAGRLAASCILVFFVAFFENYLQVVHFWDGVIAGALCAIGIVLPTHLFLFVRGGESRGFFLLEMGLTVFNLTLVGGVLAG